MTPGIGPFPTVDDTNAVAGFNDPDTAFGAVFWGPGRHDRYDMTTFPPLP